MSLDYQINRKVVLSEEIEHKSLYKWCLRELDDSGKQIARDQIPWGWSLNFTVTEFNLVEGVKLETDHFVKDGPKVEVKGEKYIRAILRSGYPTDETNGAVFSMFGTDRRVLQWSYGFTSILILRRASGVRHGARRATSAKWTFGMS